MKNETCDHKETRISKKRAWLPRKCTSEKANAEAEATTDANSKGGSHLAQIPGLHHRKFPQQTLLLTLVSPAHLSLSVQRALVEAEFRPHRNKEQAGSNTVSNLVPQMKRNFHNLLLYFWVITLSLFVIFWSQQNP